MTRQLTVSFLAIAWIACGGGGGTDEPDAALPDVPPDVVTDVEPDAGPEVLDDGIPDPGPTDPGAPEFPTELPDEPASDAMETDSGGPAVVLLPEETVAEPVAPGPMGFVLANESWDGAADIQYPTAADFTQTIEGLVYNFRPWVRYRMPHPGTVKRIFLYSAPNSAEPGAVEVHLSTGFPGGHWPCLDEDTGDDPYAVGPTFRMELGPEPGWRVFDLSSAGHEVGGYDEFFVIIRQEGSARVGLFKANQPQPRDYSIFGGLIADAPGDDMACFPTSSTFTNFLDQPLIWLARVEIEASEVLDQHLFKPAADGPGLGGHISFGDADGDGHVDMLSGGTLWQNDGAGAFTNVTEAAGLTGVGGETVWGDYDNDGHRDILAVGGKARLFHNDGDGTFTEVTEASGIIIDANSQGVAWVDFDGDGFLDFYAASYGTLEDSEIATRDYLFHNNGDGTFTDVNTEVGMPVGAPGGYHGRGVCVADYDVDGDPDIYVGNYRLDPNQLWRNKGGMAGFKEVSSSAGVKGDWEIGSYGHTIGPSWGDLDNDGLLDLLVPNLAHPRFIGFSDPTTVYINSGDGTFETFETPEKGILYDETHSGSALFDADNDGDLDLFLTSVYEGRRSQFYDNDGTGMFTDVTYAAGIQHFNGWGCAAADVDHDGDLDLVAHGLYVNQSDEGHYLKVKLTGGAVPGAAAGQSNRDAIGAWVRIEVGQAIQIRQVEGGKGTGCQNGRVLHFGLGEAAKVDSLTVYWPSGKSTELTDVTADQTLDLMEPAS